MFLKVHLLRNMRFNLILISLVLIAVLLCGVTLLVYMHSLTISTQKVFTHNFTPQPLILPRGPTTYNPQVGEGISTNPLYQPQKTCYKFIDETVCQ